jgi:hypothetical protein
MKSIIVLVDGISEMPENELVEHWRILQRAGNIYNDRSRVRGQMWRTMPPSDKIRELDERVKRIDFAYRGHFNVPADIKAVIVEDALDVINYATFLIRQIEEGASG